MQKIPIVVAFMFTMIRASAQPDMPIDPAPIDGWSIVLISIGVMLIFRMKRQTSRLASQ